MASAVSKTAASSLLGDVRARERTPSDAAITAWVWSIPCAVAAIVAIVVLGPVLGGLLLPSHSPYRFIGPVLTGLHPEPTEQGRYLVAVCVPLLAALALATAAARAPRLSEEAVAPVVIGTQMVLVGVVVASLVAQYDFTFGIRYTRGFQNPFGMKYFTLATLGVSLALTLAVATVLHAEMVRARATAWLRAESRRRRIVFTGLAALATAVWILHAVHSDAEIGNAVEDVRYHLSFTLDETFAVINGRTPLVDFTAQYGSLWPFALALPVVVFGKSLLAFSIAACAVSALALLAVYGVLRRATGSALAALLLYLPFLATSLFMVGGTLQSRSSAGSYYASFPLRYALPYFVAWLTARRLERPQSTWADWLLFTAAGLAVLNNGDFGVAAFGATLAAIVWSERPTRRSVLRLLACAAAGLVTALALVSLVTLARAGSLPQLDRLVSYARMYVRGGFALMPIPGVLGMHLLIYLTYVAAVLVATVRALRRAENRVLTAMLAWAGMFGLGAGAYWVGRSHPVALVYEFSAWAFALTLLTAVAVPELARRRPSRSAIGALVVLFGFFLATCSLAQTPLPWEQLSRLRGPFVASEIEPDPNPLAASPRPSVRRFVSSLADGPSRFVVRPDAPIAILLPNGHRVADEYGVVNVAPYTGAGSLETAERVKDTVAALRSAGGNTIVLPNPINPGILTELRRLGFYVLTQEGLRPFSFHRQRSLLLLPWPGGGEILKWVDMRNLHPRALSERAQP